MHHLCIFQIEKVLRQDLTRRVKHNTLCTVSTLKVPRYHAESKRFACDEHLDEDSAANELPELHSLFDTPHSVVPNADFAMHQLNG